MSIRLLTVTEYEHQVVESQNTSMKLLSPEYEHQDVVSHRIRASG